MKNSGLYYIELKKLKKDEEKIPSQRLLTTQKTGPSPVLNLKKVEVTPEEDWLGIAEETLPHLRNAISQDRKRLNNEIYRERVELVRKTSSVTVRELARHSENLVENEGGVMPKTLSVPKNDEDYNIYDNRFLYTVLVTLNRFTTGVLQAAGEASMEKTRLCFDVKYEKGSGNLALSGEFTSSGSFLDGVYSERSFRRVDTIVAETAELLESPLMSMFDDNDILELPIQPTNAILMDPDFVEANELLEFLSTYNKPGFTVREYEADNKALSGVSIDEFNSIVPLFSALCEAESGAIDRKSFDTAETRKSIYELVASGEKLNDDELRAAIEEIEAGYEERRKASGEAAKAQAEQMIRRKTDEFEKEKQELLAQITALKIANGQLGPEDFNTEESFLQLEKEKALFDDLYNRQIGVMKKRARKKYIWDPLFSRTHGKSTEEKSEQKGRKEVK